MRILTVFFILLIPLKVSFSSPQPPPALETPLGDLFDDQWVPRNGEFTRDSRSYGIACYQEANIRYEECINDAKKRYPDPVPPEARVGAEWFYNSCFDIWVDHLRYCIENGAPILRAPPRKPRDEEPPQEEAPEAPQAPPRPPVHNKVIRFLPPQA